MKFIYDSWQKKHKNPFGAVKRGTEISLSVETDADRVFLLGFGEKVELNKNGDIFEASVAPEIDCGLILYSFEAVFGGKSHFFGKSEIGGSAGENGTPYQLTVHKNESTPLWFKGKVMYQIYVDRFFKGDMDGTKLRKNALLHTSWDDKPVYVKNENGEIVIWDFFGGNLSGVIKKLDYLKELGVDVIYLNPIFESVSNHKYDTADYSKIDRMYGTEDTLKRLVREVESRGMKIMLDGVFSHTGDDSVYFNKYKTYGKGGAYNDKSSPYFKWYRFEDFPDKYYCWWGVSALPAVDELAPSYLHYLLNEKEGTVIKWMRAGVAGWRLDVADELPDEFIRKLKEAIVRVNPEAVLLGEVWEDASNKVSYGKPRKYILENSMQSVSNYPLRDALIDLLTGKTQPKDFAAKIMQLQENYPNDVFMSLMNMTGTHDTVRLFTLLGDAPEPQSMDTWQQREYALPGAKKELALKRLMLYYAAIFTLPGNPCIYYGDEICMEGYADPYNRGTFDWDTDKTHVVELIKELVALRRRMMTGEVFLNFDMRSEILDYTLSSDKENYRVLINHTEIEKRADSEGYESLFLHNAKIDENMLILRPFSAAVLRKKGVMIARQVPYKALYIPKRTFSS